jgi:hypothetical protein
MAEFMRKDSDLLSEQSKASDRDAAENLDPLERTPDVNSRTFLEPPPAQPGLAAATNRSPAAGASAAPALDSERIALFTPPEANGFRSQWNSIQVGFVDEPRKSVEEADALVAATINRLSEIFVDERQKLEQQWDRDGDISTEDFRLALRRYRSFFARLLAI